MYFKCNACHCAILWDSTCSVAVCVVGLLPPQEGVSLEGRVEIPGLLWQQNIYSGKMCALLVMPLGEALLSPV